MQNIPEDCHFVNLYCRTLGHLYLYCLTCHLESRILARKSITISIKWGSDKLARQPASIIEVAKLAGVSVASASRVLSKSSYPVSLSTREKVLQAARELNYATNSLARNLRAQRSFLLAVL